MLDSGPQVGVNIQGKYDLFFSFLSSDGVIEKEAENSSDKHSTAKMPG